MTAGRQEVWQPVRVFLYTLDQIASMLDLSEESLVSRHIYFAELSTGVKNRNTMEARNIAKLGDDPVWRVSDIEFKAWLRRMGFVNYDQTTRDRPLRRS